jgi:drug/metabolite transporter (DMT)-like permease
MANKKTRKANYTLWFTLGLSSYILTSPSAMVAKIITSSGLDAFAYSIIRYTIMAAIIIPIAAVAVLRHREAVAKHWRAAVVAGICLGLAGIAWALAIAVGKASHVNIINLLTPIMLVILSAKIIHDKVSHRATVGITLAAIGGVLVVAVPMIVAGSIESSANPLSVALTLVNCLFFPISMVYMRRANESGVPITFMIAVSCVFTVLVSLVLEPIVYGTTVIESLGGISTFHWILMVGYVGIFVGLIVRVISVKSYEAVGAAVAGGFEYLHTLLAILLPILILHETLSPEIIVGALLILLGIYLTESHHHMGSHIHLAHHYRKARRK